MMGNEMSCINMDGTYWTIKELAKKTGLKYIQVYNLLSEYNGIVNIGSMKFVPDHIAQEIINLPNMQEETVALTVAARELNIGRSIIYQLVNLGLPTVRVIKKRRITKKTYGILESVIREYQEQYKCIPNEKIPDVYKNVMERLNQQKEADDI